MTAREFAPQKDCLGAGSLGKGRPLSFDKILPKIIREMLIESINVAHLM